MEQLNKNKHTHFRDRRTAAEQRTPAVTCYWAEHTVWDRADLANLPSPSQARGQSQAGPAWLCTAHARPAPAAIHRGDTLTPRARALALRGTIIWQLRFRFASPMKHDILPLLSSFPKTSTQPPPRAARRGTLWRCSPAADRACPGGHVHPVLLWLWKSQPQDTTTSLERSPKTVCPDWDDPTATAPMAGKAGTQPTSRAA